jgi:hypothetical protein
MGAQWYYRRMVNLLSYISDASHVVLPVNGKVVGSFLTSYEVAFIQNVLAGLQGVEQWDGADWERNTYFLKFKDYIVDVETKMDKILRTLTYYIDAENALNLVTGGIRVERVRT